MDKWIHNKKGEKVMNCFYCKGTLKESITTHVVKIKACIIIIKNVPCTECVQCGETFYDNDVALQIEKITKEMRTAVTEIAVVNFVAA
jgi:YgiT-type zinc finger domain-containing protein